jgi:hypothetical protein
MYASAVLTVERPGALVLPAAALLVHEDQPTVFRVEDGEAVRTPVKLGARLGPLVEVIKKQAKPARRGEPITWESFTGQEEVVVANPSALAYGQAVGSPPASGQMAQVAGRGAKTVGWVERSEAHPTGRTDRQAGRG